MHTTKHLIIENKQNKKGDRWETAMFLEKKLGETKDHAGSTDSDGPLCKGVYNSTTAIAVRLGDFSPRMTEQFYLPG